MIYNFDTPEASKPKKAKKMPKNGTFSLISPKPKVVELSFLHQQMRLLETRK
jgi:hypothetical protein